MTRAVRPADWSPPMTVAVPTDYEGLNGVEVIVHADGAGLGILVEFPTSVLDLVSSCFETIDDLGSYAVDGPPEPNLSQLSVDELVAALRDALGQVRIFNVLEDSGMTD